MTAAARSGGRLARARWVPRALLTALVLALFALGAGYVAVTRGGLIDPARFARPDDGFTVLDRHGVALRHVRVDGVDRRWVPLSAISPNLVAAVLAAEDADFFRHRGVDGRAVFRAAARNLLPGGRLSGASTLSQQLVKRVYGRPAGGVARAVAAKLVEALRAVALERTFTKDEILEQYLNRVPFGDQIEGVARASEEYFGRPVGQLSVAEAALLAGVPQAPSVTEPRRHLARALARRDWVLGRMRATGAIDAAVYRAALAERPVIRAAPARPYEAPRFVDAALAAARAGAIARETGGALATSLDLGLQQRAEAVLAAAVDRFDARGVRNGAAIVVANATGEVLAYVGAARGGAHAPGGQLDLLAARRQPGSTLKPFVYELFFERGGTGATLLDDVALGAMTGARGASFEARDFDGRERGPVRARVALSASLNLAALDAARRVGADAVLARMRALGFAPAGGAERFGAAVVLGGVDVAPAELARAYVALARGGTLVPLALAPPTAPPRGVAVLRPEAARMTWDILADPGARADAFGADLADLAGEGGPFALKTGTSAGFHDAWAAVADERFTVVAWLGDPNGAALAQVAGFEAAAPAAVRLLALARRRAEVDGAVPVTAPPVRLVEVEVCAFSGLRVGPRCRHATRERFPEGRVPREVCGAHDARGAGVLPARYAAWAARAQPAGVTVADPAAAPARGGRASGQGATAVEPAPAVREPRDGARWLLDPARPAATVTLRATVAGIDTPGVAWEVDGAPLAEDRWRVTPGAHTFVAVHHGQRSAPARLTVTLAGAARLPVP